MNGYWPPIIAALVSIVGTATVTFGMIAMKDRRDFMDRLARNEQSIALQGALIEDLRQTNKGILKELKAIRLGMAKAGITVEVDP